ncbi:MAG: penicillin acylase family protein, partial [Spirochaetaceae bacterium]|nr:penicillin acylase family protein [Spirochaetaceae bacterium]
LRRKWPGLWASAQNTLDGLMELPFCRDVAEGLDAARRAEGIDLNWVFGDRDGHIGNQMSGSPIRHDQESDGILPQLGWSPEFREPEVCSPIDLPRQMDPEDGFLVTANQRIKISGYPVLQSLPFSPDRANRIRDLLSETSDIDRSDMQRIQYDLLSLQARRVMDFCRPYLPDDARAFAKWDCRFDIDSRCATLYDAFGRRLLHTVLRDRLIPSHMLEAVLTGSFLELASHKLFEDAYGTPDGPFRDVHWKTVVPEIYREALREVRAGPRRRPKRWGRANRLILRHPVLGRSVIRRFVNSGPFEYPGYGSTPFQGRTVNHDRANEHTTGPTYHLIVDFGEGAAYTNAPSGRTERPLDQHYRLGIASWLTGRYERFTPPSEEDFERRSVVRAVPEAQREL